MNSRIEIVRKCSEEMQQQSALRDLHDWIIIATVLHHSIIDECLNVLRAVNVAILADIKFRIACARVSHISHREGLPIRIIRRADHQKGCITAQPPIKRDIKSSLE